MGMMSIIPTDWKVNINFMHFLLTHLSFVPVYGIADIHSVNNIIQHMDKVTQNGNKQQPCEYGNKVGLQPKSTDSF